MEQNYVTVTLFIHKLEVDDGKPVGECLRPDMQGRTHHVRTHGPTNNAET